MIAEVEIAATNPDHAENFCLCVLKLKGEILSLFIGQKNIFRVLTSFFVSKNKPALGVSPPSLKAEHNSIRSAPASLALTADKIESTQTSNATIFDENKLKSEPTNNSFFLLEILNATKGDKSIKSLDRGLQVVSVVSFLLEAPLWIFFGVARRQIHHESSALSHNDHRADPLLLVPAKSCNSSRKHAAVFTNILTKYQDVRVFYVKSQSALRTELHSFTFACLKLLNQKRLIGRRYVSPLNHDGLLAVIAFHFD